MGKKIFYAKLLNVVIIDFIFTVLLCGLSFISDFPFQLIAIFFIGFVGRLIFIILHGNVKWQQVK